MSSEENGIFSFEEIDELLRRGKRGIIFGGPDESRKKSLELIELFSRIKTLTYRDGVGLAEQGAKTVAKVLREFPGSKITSITR